MEVFNGDLLPTEIIIKIYEHLRLYDIKNASLTSKHWYLASLHYTIMAKRLVEIFSERIHYSDVVYTELINSILPFNNLEVCNSPNCLKDTEFWRKMSQHLKHLSIKLTESVNFFDALKELKHLISFELTTFEDVNSKQLNIKNTNTQLNKLKDLNLHGAGDLSWVPHVLSMMPEIVHMELLFPNELEPQFVQTICEYLNDGKNRIKTFFLYADNSAWDKILELRGMNLEMMSFLNKYPKLESNFNEFTDPMKLLHLTISGKDYTDKNYIYKISMQFPNLETFLFSGHNSINLLTDLSHLKKLQSLFIQNVFFPNASGIFPESLQTLYLWSTTVKFHTFDNLSNLTFLSCVGCSMFTNDTLQEMFKHLKSLKHLQIHHAYGSSVTDFGFTGIVDGQQVGHSISGLIYLETLYIHIRDSGITPKTLIHITQLSRLKSLEMGLFKYNFDDDSQFPDIDFIGMFPLLKTVDINTEYDFLIDNIEELIDESYCDIYRFTDKSKISPTSFKLFHSSAQKFIEELILELEDNVVW